VHVVLTGEALHGRSGFCGFQLLERKPESLLLSEFKAQHHFLRGFVGLGRCWQQLAVAGLGETAEIQSLPGRRVQIFHRSNRGTTNKKTTVLNVFGSTRPLLSPAASLQQIRDRMAHRIT